MYSKNLTGVWGAPRGAREGGARGEVRRGVRGSSSGRRRHKFASHPKRVICALHRWDLRESCGSVKRSPRLHPLSTCAQSHGKQSGARGGRQACLRRRATIPVMLHRCTIIFHRRILYGSWLTTSVHSTSHSQTPAPRCARQRSAGLLQLGLSSISTTCSRCARLLVPHS